MSTFNQNGRPVSSRFSVQFQSDFLSSLRQNLHLKATYRVREAFRLVRSPFITGGEVDAALEEYGPSDASDQADHWGTEGERAVYNRRLALLSEAFSDLDVEILEAEVLWGTQVRDQLKPLRECKGKLVSSLWMYFHLKDKRQLDEGDRERLGECESIIWDVPSVEEYEVFTRRIEAAVGEIETLVRPHLHL